MRTHHGWRVSVHGEGHHVVAQRWAIPAEKVHDDFAVLAAALDCCQALDKAGRTGIELFSVEREGSAERLERLNWRRLAKAAA